MIFVSSALTMLPLFAAIGFFKFSTAVSTPHVIILTHQTNASLALGQFYGKVDICSKNVLTVLCHTFTLSFILDKKHIETWQKKNLTC